MSLARFALASLLASIAASAEASAQVLDEDDCIDSGVDSIVGSGMWDVSTSSGQTGAEGQSEAGCSFMGVTGIAYDIWFTWTATVDGRVVMETCFDQGANRDWKMAAWPSTTPCPVDGTSITCNDDTCGFDPSIEFAVTAGTSYIIQIGHYPLGNPGPSNGRLRVVETEITPQPTSCLDNWSFESGDLTGWTVDDIPGGALGTSVELAGTPHGFDFVSVIPSDGAYALRTDFDGAGPGRTKISQELAVSPSTSPMTIDLRAAWNYSITNTATEARTVDLVVRPAGGGPALQSTRLLTANPMPQTNLDTGPIRSQVDLSAFMGQTVTVSIEIEIPEPYTGPGVLQIDRITCPGGPPGIAASYCYAAENSTGASASIYLTGSPILAQDDVRLVATGMPPGQAGIFATSMSQAALPVASGVLCLGPPLGRFQAPGQILQVDAAGEFSLRIDTAAVPLGGATTTILPGQTWNFTAWFRDVDPMGGSTANFSDGASVTFF